MEDTTNEHEVPEPTLAHEVDSQAGVAQRHLASTERELALVDQIIVLQNKLAEAQHRYKLAGGDARYAAPPPPVVERFARSKSVYGAVLKVPVLGVAARSTVRSAKKVRRGSR